MNERMYEWGACIVCTGINEPVKIMNGMIVCDDI